MAGYKPTKLVNDASQAAGPSSSSKGKQKATEAPGNATQMGPEEERVNVPQLRQFIPDGPTFDGLGVDLYNATRTPRPARSDNEPTQIAAEWSLGYGRLTFAGPGEVYGIVKLDDRLNPRVAKEQDVKRIVYSIGVSGIQDRKNPILIMMDDQQIPRDVLEDMKAVDINNPLAEIPLLDIIRLDARRERELETQILFQYAHGYLLSSDEIQDNIRELERLRAQRSHLMAVLVNGNHRLLAMEERVKLVLEAIEALIRKHRRGENFDQDEWKKVIDELADVTYTVQVFRKDTPAHVLHMLAENQEEKPARYPGSGEKIWSETGRQIHQIRRLRIDNPHLTEEEAQDLDFKRKVRERDAKRLPTDDKLEKLVGARSDASEEDMSEVAVRNLLWHPLLNAFAMDCRNHLDVWTNRVHRMQVDAMRRPTGAAFICHAWLGFRILQQICDVADQDPNDVKAASDWLEIVNEEDLHPAGNDEAREHWLRLHSTPHAVVVYVSQFEDIIHEAADAYIRNHAVSKHFLLGAFDPESDDALVVHRNMYRQVGKICRAQASKNGFRGLYDRALDHVGVSMQLYSYLPTGSDYAIQGDIASSPDSFWPRAVLPTRTRYAEYCATSYKPFAKDKDYVGLFIFQALLNPYDLLWTEMSTPTSNTYNTGGWTSSIRSLHRFVQLCINADNGRGSFYARVSHALYVLESTALRESVNKTAQHLGEDWMAEQRVDFALKKSGSMQLPAIHKHWETMYREHGSPDDLHAGLLQAAKSLGSKAYNETSEAAWASVWQEIKPLKIIPVDIFILMKPYRWIKGWVLTPRNHAQTTLCAIGWCLFVDYLRKIVLPSLLDQLPIARVMVNAASLVFQDHQKWWLLPQPPLPPYPTYSASQEPIATYSSDFAALSQAFSTQELPRTPVNEIIDSRIGRVLVPETQEADDGTPPIRTGRVLVPETQEIDGYIQSQASIDASVREVANSPVTEEPIPQPSSPPRIQAHPRHSSRRVSSTTTLHDQSETAPARRRSKRLSALRNPARSDTEDESVSNDGEDESEPEDEIPEPAGSESEGQDEEQGEDEGEEQSGDEGATSEPMDQGAVSEPGSGSHDSRSVDDAGDATMQNLSIGSNAGANESTEHHDNLHLDDTIMRELSSSPQSQSAGAGSRLSPVLFSPSSNYPIERHLNEGEGPHSLLEGAPPVGEQELLVPGSPLHHSVLVSQQLAGTVPAPPAPPLPPSSLIDNTRKLSRLSLSTVPSPATVENIEYTVLGNIKTTALRRGTGATIAELDVEFGTSVVTQLSDYLQSNPGHVVSDSRTVPYVLHNALIDQRYSIHPEEHDVLNDYMHRNMGALKWELESVEIARQRLRSACVSVAYSLSDGTNSYSLMTAVVGLPLRNRELLDNYMCELAEIFEQSSRITCAGLPESPTDGYADALRLMRTDNILQQQLVYFHETTGEVFVNLRPTFPLHSQPRLQENRVRFPVCRFRISDGDMERIRNRLTHLYPVLSYGEDHDGMERRVTQGIVVQSIRQEKEVQDRHPDLDFLGNVDKHKVAPGNFAEQLTSIMHPSKLPHEYLPHRLAFFSQRPVSQGATHAYSTGGKFRRQDTDHLDEKALEFVVEAQETYRSAWDEVNAKAIQDYEVWLASFRESQRDRLTKFEQVDLGIYGLALPIMPAFLPDSDASGATNQGLSTATIPAANEDREPDLVVPTSQSVDEGRPPQYRVLSPSPSQFAPPTATPSSTNVPSYAPVAAQSTQTFHPFGARTPTPPAHHSDEEQPVQTSPPSKPKPQKRARTSTESSAVGHRHTRARPSGDLEALRQNLPK